MDCKNYFENTDMTLYFRKCIDRLFACLKIYEDIEEEKATFKQLSVYIQRLLLEFQGLNKLYSDVNLISLIDTLNGIDENLENLNHSQMKSDIFYCIDIVKKCGKSL